MSGGAVLFFFFFFQAEDGIRDYKVTGVQTCALPISWAFPRNRNRADIGNRGSRCRVAVQPSSCGGYGEPAGVEDGVLVDRKSGGEGKRGDLGGRRII